MRITLATSPFFDHGAFCSDAESSAQVYLPLGLLTLAAPLVEDGFRVNITDLNEAYNRGQWKDEESLYLQAAEVLGSSEPDVLGIMTAYDSYHHVLRIAQEFKLRHPNVPIVFGGYQASVVDQATLERFPFIDAIVRGEGEESFLSLVRCYKEGRSPTGLSGVTAIEGGVVVRNPDRALIPDLDQLPFPAYDLYPVDPKKYVYLEVGRGCPFQCTYCSTAPFWRRKTRYKSAERVVREMTMLRDRHSVTQFHFVHDLFTVNRQWVRKLCAAIKDSGLEARWTCSASINTLSDDLIESMASAGCVGMYLGVESGSEEIRTLVKKEFDSLRAEILIRKILAAGIAPVTGFIAGFPFETEQSFRQTLRTFFDFKRMGVPLAHLFVAIPESGSPLYREHKDGLHLAGHFLDFPVSPRLREQNIDLFRQHPDIFSSMYRFTTASLDAELCRGIDEFSPLVNTVSQPIMVAVDRMGDPVQFYRNWLSWIATRNRSRRRSEAELFYGSIEDMLDYIGWLQESGIIDIEYLPDLLRYERIKNEFRRRSDIIEHDVDKRRKVDALANDDSPGLNMSWYLLQSPYNRVESFSWDLQPLYATDVARCGAPIKRPTFVLFFASPRQQAVIGDFFKDVMLDISTLRIDPLTKVVLEISDGKTSLQEICNTMGSIAECDLDITPERSAALVMDRVRQLRDLGVISFVGTGYATTV